MSSYSQRSSRCLAARMNSAGQRILLYVVSVVYALMPGVSATLLESVNLSWSTGGSGQASGTQESIQFVMANFGSVPYGSSLRAPLYYPSSSTPQASGHSCGEQPCEWGCHPFAEASPPFNFQLSIVLLDRVPTAKQRAATSNCTHVEKAFNAQQSGAAAVIIVDTDDTPNIAVVEGNRLWNVKEQVSIPVGMVTKSDGQKLKALLQNSGQESPTVVLDFANPITETPEVLLEVWHDSNDACGTRCEVTQGLLTDLAMAISAFTASDAPVVMRPRYIFTKSREPCNTELNPLCASSCVNNRYCNYDVPADSGATGKQMVEEDIRRLCLWHTLHDQHKKGVFKAKTPQGGWWAYVLASQRTCSSKDGKMSAECAIKAARAAHITEEAVLAAWQHCAAAANSGKEIDLVEKELEAASGKEEDSELSRVLLNPTLRINTQQYRGSLDQTSVLKAVCAAFVDTQEPSICNSLGHMDCLPDAPGAKECGSDENVKARRSTCVDTFMGYKCACDAGFVESVAPGGKVTCVDVNECIVGDPCGMASGKRTACHNTAGSFWCEESIPNECTQQNDYGGCWVHNDASIVDSFTGHASAPAAACQDNLAAYQRAAMAGTADGRKASDVPLSVCTCGALPGCWVGDGKGGCKRACDGDACVEMPNGGHTCVSGGSNGVPQSAIIGSVFAAIVLLATLGLALMYHRRQVKNDVQSALSRYIPLDSSPETGQMSRGSGSRSGRSSGGSSRSPNDSQADTDMMTLAAGKDSADLAAAVENPALNEC